MSDSEGEGDAFKITEEIMDDKEDEEKVVVREERYVNDQGKTVVRRVYKKKKTERKKKKRSKSRQRDQKKTVGGFSGIPKDDDDDVPELMRLKLKSRTPKEPKEGDGEGSDEDESIPEWQRKKLKSTNSNRGGDGRNRSESTVEEDVFNFRQLLKKRPDSPVIEKKGKIESNTSGTTDFRTMLKSRATAGGDVEKGPSSTSAGADEEKPNFLSVLKPTKRVEDPVADKAKPEQDGKPNFLSVLKKNTTEPIEVHKSAPAKEEPVWRQVRLRPSGSTTPAASGNTQNGTPNGTQNEDSSKPKFGIGSLRKTEAGSTLTEEELAIKARESELKAIQRKNERLQKEEKERSEKQLLVADIMFLRNQKETLLKEVEELTNKLTKLRQEEKAASKAN